MLCILKHGGSNDFPIPHSNIRKAQEHGLAVADRSIDEELWETALNSSLIQAHFQNTLACSFHEQLESECSHHGVIVRRLDSAILGSATLGSGGFGSVFRVLNISNDIPPGQTPPTRALKLIPFKTELTQLSLRVTGEFTTALRAWSVLN